MSDEFQLQIRPKDDDSSQRLSPMRSGLIARGRRDAAMLATSVEAQRPKLEAFETLEAYLAAIVDWKLDLRIYDSAADTKRGKPRLDDFPALEDYLVEVVDWILSARPFLDCFGIRQPRLDDFTTLEDYCVELVHWNLDRRWFDLWQGCPDDTFQDML